MNRRCLLLLGLLCLCGCMANPLRPPRDEWPEIGNEFAKSLRWAGPDLAATFFSDASRPAFLAAFGSDAGLQLVNLRHDAAGPPAGISARGVLVFEYYRSPSVSVKKANVPLEWSCQEVGPLLPCRWLITTEMGRLP